jgi:curli biogenesis system outer membrane secretion channel CsgG
MSTVRRFLLWAVIPVFLVLSGCGSAPLVFLNRSFDFNYIEKIAVIPFDNLSQSQGAGQQATLMFVTEVLATETFDVVEMGETSKALAEMNLTRTSTLDVEQIIQLGKRLKVQGLVFGTIGESSVIRSGGYSNPSITMDLRLVETETGATVWAATHTQSGANWLSTLFGVTSQSSSETMRKCIHNILKTLVK